MTLIERAYDVEFDAALAADTPNLAGAYIGWPIGHEDSWPSQFLNGESAESWFDDGDTSVLCCTCGTPGCWDLTTIISISDTTVTWSNFRMGHRDWDLSSLGPFRFDKAQYLQALSDASGIPLEELASPADHA